MTREQRIDGVAFLAALVCAVTFPHTAGAETGHAPASAAAAPGAHQPALDWKAWPRR